MVTTDYFQPKTLNKITRLELRARHVVEGFLNGLHRSPYRGFSIEFADHREYVPGDDLRHLDWRVYAKADRFYIKQYEVETNLRAYLLLDASGSMQYPAHHVEDRMNKWQYASTIAASLAYMMVKQQDGAGLILFDHEIRNNLPVTTNPAQLRNMVEMIEQTAPTEETQTKVLFRYLADQLPKRSMVVLISDLLTDIDELKDGLERFRFGHHDVMVFHVLDKDELEFPFTDRTLFEGLEYSTDEILTDPQSLRTAYLDRVRAFIHDVQSICLNSRIDYVQISTADPLDVALTRFLSNRMHQTKSMA